MAKKKRKGGKYPQRKKLLKTYSTQGNLMYMHSLVKFAQGQGVVNFRQFEEKLPELIAQHQQLQKEIAAHQKQRQLHRRTLEEAMISYNEAVGVIGTVHGSYALDVVLQRLESKIKGKYGL